MPKGIILRTQLDVSFICGMLLKLYKHNKLNLDPLKYMKIRVKKNRKAIITSIYINIQYLIKTSSLSMLYF